MKKFIIALTGLILSGCASLSKEECLHGNWYVIGYRDGTQGYDMQRLESHQKACAEHGAAPDFQPYRAGRQIGLVYYCADSKAHAAAEVDILNDGGNWYLIGRDHGQHGLPYDVERIRDRCKPYHIALDEERYRDGYKAGAREFCTPENGNRIGRNAEPYHFGVCGPYEKAFIEEYLLGLDSAFLEVEDKIARERNAYQDYLHRLRDTRDEKKRSYLEGELDGIQRSLDGLEEELRKIHSLRLDARHHR